MTEPEPPHEFRPPRGPRADGLAWYALMATLGFIVILVGAVCANGGI